MVVVGTIIGFRFSAGVLAALGFFGLALAFGFAMSWIAVNIGLKVRSTEAAQSAGFVWLFPLTFASSAFVPVGSMPGWLQAFAERNPITIMVNALRALTLGGPTATHVWPALAWIVAITPLAVRQYRRLA